ncbi:MAG: hypothetical protein AAFX09_04740 [Pseudomonadota bacterium]
MSASVFLAWLIGPTLTVIGLAILINREYYRDMVERFFNDPQDYYFSGVAALLTGLAIIALHNRWTADWSVFITVFGWAALLKGLVRLLFPQFGRGLFEGALKTHSYLVLSGVIMVPLGLYLTWQAWSAGALAN